MGPGVWPLHEALPSPSAEVGGPAEGATSDLEDRLTGPEGPAVRARTLSRLAHLQAGFDAKVRQGLTPETYKRTKEILEALASARAFLANDRTP